MRLFLISILIAVVFSLPTTTRQVIASSSHYEADTLPSVQEEKAKLDSDFSKAVGDKTYADAFRLGKDILRADQNRLDVRLALGWLGYIASTTQNNNNYNDEAISYAQQAIKDIESGKRPIIPGEQDKEERRWAPFKNREDALGMFHFILGHFFMKASKFEEAAVYYYNLAQLKGTLVAKEPSVYANLGAVYSQSSGYKKLIQDYKALVTKDPNSANSDEAKAILAKVDPHTDRIIDAYARAVALATNERYATQKANWMKRLTDFYKFRNKSDVGLTDLINGVLAKPLPQPSPAQATTN